MSELVHRPTTEALSYPTSYFASIVVRFQTTRYPFIASPLLGGIDSRYELAIQILLELSIIYIIHLDFSDHESSFFPCIRTQSETKDDLLNLNS